ncbi:MAG: hypothetical protein J2P26_10395, partial [Nocardiopsaceae bacterium]|nr:hypothetical protein [Nocardiopsaceae bacterium]
MTPPPGTAGGDRPLFEIAPLDPAGPPVRRWWPGNWRAIGLLTPAAAVVAAGLAAPLLVTFVVSIAGGDGALANYGAVLRDASVGRAMAHSALWVAFALALCLIGLGVAWLAHRAHGQAHGHTGRIVVAVLAAPVAVSPFVAGTASRLLFG